MKTYTKIPNIFKRDSITNKLIDGDYCNDEVAYLANLEWSCTEKIDGTNIGIVWDGYNLSFQGRTEKAQIPKHLMEYLQTTFGNKEELFEQMFGVKNMILFGEGFGHKIQSAGNKYLGDEVSFILFDVYAPDSNTWLNRDSVVSIGEQLNINVVPEVFRGTLPEAVEYVKSFPKSTIGTADMEGVVAKPTTELIRRNNDRVIVKIKACDWK